MNDMLDKPLIAGDNIVMILPGHTNLVKGKVINFTPYKVRVSFLKYERYNETLQSADQLVKIL